jgi:hypothetical protein
MFLNKDIMSLSDKERLIQFGYRPEHIIEFPDGSALLDLESIKMDWAQRMTQKLFFRQYL